MAAVRRWTSSHAKDRDDGADTAEHKSAPGDQKPVPLHDPERLLDDLSKEYYAILDRVSGFDQRLMTIKGWSVTVSLAALGLAFQQGHYAFFALAAGTGIVFWIIDILTKRHQVRNYPRMRDIEIAASQLNYIELRGKLLSAPRADWTWSLARKGSVDSGDERPKPRTEEETRKMLSNVPWRGNVMLPHVVAVVLGVALFIAAVLNAPGLGTLKP